MKRKTCPRCGGRSYSSDADPWICPYCGADLSEVEFDEWRPVDDR